MNIVFFGTHAFGATILKGLIESPFISVTGVVTQPDRPVGRKQELQKSPVKLLAEEKNIEIFQPKSLKQFDVSLVPADMYVVAQYGLLIPPAVLDATKYGTLNTHTSLLPKYRGASPIQSAIRAGEKITGVTIMKMDVGLDTGPIYSQEETEILPDETYLELDARLADIAVPQILEVIQKIENNSIEAQPQDDSIATLCGKLSREDGRVDFSNTSSEIYNQYRAFTPWPGIWTTINDKRLKLLAIQKSDEKIDTGKLAYKNDTILIGCGDTAIEVRELQLEGKAKMTAEQFVHGYTKFNNTILGTTHSD